jgi:MscS family membrane protein
MTLLVAIAIIGILLIGQLGLVSLTFAVRTVTSPEFAEIYRKVIRPHRALLGGVLILGLFELTVWLLFGAILQVPWYATVEIPTTLGLTIALGWLGNRLFNEYFDRYLLDAAAKSGRKVDSEFLFLAKFFANFAIIVGLVVLFGQTHNLNIFGVIASLGIGGIAIAFAAQKVLEQLLGGIVIYIDRPFSIDDYIGLSDGTYGRVESIGLRSTKIRTSGKGTLMIVPNNAVIQANVENFTGAKKVMALLYLNFHRLISDEEQALIQQVVLDCTKDIFGIDARSTNIVFKRESEQGRTQAQITFFILGSQDVSMTMRRQLLDIANQNITDQLKAYGIAFDIEAPTIYVDSPITI